MSASPINAMLDPSVGCRHFTDDISVHWYPQDAVPGDACHRGEKVMRNYLDEDLAETGRSHEEGKT